MKATIGIEVHAELKTKSKMFCGCLNDPHASAPNKNICPVCMAHPGTLPSVNKEAVLMVRKVGAAIGGTLANFSEFDRKNYFYPDIPKAYQLSQYESPLVSGGKLAEVAITRIHLEEDTAKSQHTTNSVVDFNRAGVPLMELVTEPVIHSAADAVTFAKELQLLLRTLDVSDANMEKGEMRVEANISVSDSDKLGTKVEVKNLNSFKILETAIKHEISRQTENLRNGEKVVQETRGWDEAKGKTFSQRVKETADDYRYFPDPDIPKYKLMAVEGMSSADVSNALPVLPQEVRERFTALGLQTDQVDILLADKPLRGVFEEVLILADGSESVAKLAANYLTSDIVYLLDESGKSADEVRAKNFHTLLSMLENAEITSRIAKDLLPEVLFTDSDVRALVEERGLLQQNNSDDLLPVVQAILAANESVVAEYKAGKEAALKYLVGQGMKQTKGAGNPRLLSELFVSEMNK
tara:strand:+ start:3993 stop:5393 length:1401 start_codon:yes stop_codon:yes gene_type:complete